MIVRYLFSSPEGDIPLQAKDLSRPFLVTREKAHPHLTLGHYFDVLKACVLKDQGQLLKWALKDRWHKDWGLEDVEILKIRSEKHGILYHLASVEVFLGEIQSKFTLSTAVSGPGIACLVREHDILGRLNRTCQLTFLPEIYGIRKMACPTDHGTTEEMVILSAQWFDDFHEWHLAMDPVDGRKKIKIWDLRRGHRYASSKEAFRIIEECSRILALYYDDVNFRQIGDWHHAAGDFIVNTRGDGKVNVRLTTVRKYEPLMASLSKEDVNPVVAMIYFFLDTTVQMRLDRLDGVGEMVWLDDFALTATIKGFFEGLCERKVNRVGAEGVRAEDIMKLIQSFDVRELERIFDPLLTHYAAREQDGIAFISTHMNNHINALFQAVQGMGSKLDIWTSK